MDGWFDGDAVGRFAGVLVGERTIWFTGDTVGVVVGLDCGTGALVFVFVAGMIVLLLRSMLVL